MPSDHNCTTPSHRQALSPAVTSRLKQIAVAAQYPAESIIFQYNTPSEHLFIVETGQVEINAFTNARRKVSLGILGPGDLVGEISLLDRGNRNTEARARTDVTGHRVSYAQFHAFLIANPETHIAFTIELCGRLHNVGVLVDTESEPDGSTRLAKSLLQLADRFGCSAPHGVDVQLSLSPSEISDMACLPSAHVKRFLSAWEDAGMIHFENGHLTVVNRPALAARSVSQADRAKR